MSIKEMETTIIVLSIGIIFFLYCIITQENYIQNIETKLNI